MTTRRDFLHASALSAPGVKFIDPTLRAVVSQPNASKTSLDPKASPARPRTLTSRLIFNFNQGWRFQRGDQNVPPVIVPANNRPNQLNDGTWEPVNLPHTVRLEPLNASGGRNLQGICWYTKDFPADATWKDRVIHLKFEGAMQVADVWLNGEHLLTNHCGYLPFTVDITPVLRHGAGNILSLRLNNSDNPRYLQESRRTNSISPTSEGCTEAST